MTARTKDIQHNVSNKEMLFQDPYIFTNTQKYISRILQIRIQENNIRNRTICESQNIFISAKIVFIYNTSYIYNL